MLPFEAARVWLIQYFYIWAIKHLLATVSRLDSALFRVKFDDSTALLLLDIDIDNLPELLEVLVELHNIIERLRDVPHQHSGPGCPGR